MGMKISTYTVFATMLTLISCSQEGPAGIGLSGDGNRIYFRSYLPTVTQTRAGVLTQETLRECRVTSINPDDNKHPDTGEMTTYFDDLRYEKDGEGHFLAEDEESSMWPDTKSRLHFFAYSPSAESMQVNIDDGKFKLVTHSEKAEDGTPVLDYRLEKFQVAHDIADHVDFIAAYANGTGKDNGDSGIRLDFSHRLARIEIEVWGDNDKYDFEIAGVRIGNAITEGDFCFSSLMSAEHTGEWLSTSQSAVEHIFTDGESTVILNKDTGRHISNEDATSIMGSHGTAMVIPMAEKIEAWEGKEDPDIDSPEYTTEKLYFSVLLRVTNRRDGKVAYPYPNDRDSLPTVYLSLGEDGKVSKRVYLIDEECYTANQKEEELKYTPSETEEVHAYCWASLPVGAKWEAGKIYTYKLNYSSGIGWHDPYGPNPGEPIIERGMIPFEVEMEEWLPAEGYNSNLDVPKR